MDLTENEKKRMRDVFEEFMKELPDQHKGIKLVRSRGLLVIEVTA